jgi:hypothetical protein
VTTGRDPRSTGRSSLTRAARSRLLDETPAAAFGEGTEGRPVRKPERGTQLELAERTAVGKKVALDRGRRWRDAPGGTDPAPAGCEIAPDLLGRINVNVSIDSSRMVR